MKSVRRRVTIVDVAKAAGVAVSTASRVLNGDPNQRAQPETRERIIAAAQLLKYTPSSIALALRTARTNSIGIVVPQLDNPVFTAILMGATRAAQDRGYALLIAYSDPSSKITSVYERMVEHNRIDGMLAATLEDEGRLLDTLNGMNVPFVVLNRAMVGTSAYVAFNNRAAARHAVDYLVGLGHRRIAHLAGSVTGYNGRERLAGYKEGLLEAGIRFNNKLVATAGYTSTGGEQAMHAILDRSEKRPTAVFAATLVAAAGAISMLHKRDIDIPGDISVISVHDSAIADMLYPTITTVKFSVEDMGYRATQGLIDMIEGREPELPITMEPEGLVIRNSTAAPR